MIVADVLFTGAVLGGGSDGMHKLVQVFTNFMDSTAELAGKRREAPGRGSPRPSRQQPVVGCSGSRPGAACA